MLERRDEIISRLWLLTRK